MQLPAMPPPTTMTSYDVSASVCAAVAAGCVAVANVRPHSAAFHSARAAPSGKLSRSCNGRSGGMEAKANALPQAAGARKATERNGARNGASAVVCRSKGHVRTSYGRVCAS